MTKCVATLDWSNKHIVICDLDGTLSNAEHRKYLIDGSQKKNWAEFYERCDEDDPHLDIGRLIRKLADSGLTIVYVTGRVESVREKTEAWLEKHDMPSGAIFMRPDGDYRQDCILKAEIAEQQGLTPERVFLALDDRDQVVKMWRELGIRCLQVAEGNF